jgi:hypothetical protein
MVITIPVIATIWKPRGTLLPVAQTNQLTAKKN